MNGLILTLFGQPNLRQQDQVVELKSRKGWALLAYLALTPGPIGRETLAALFWPEHDAVGARRNLRRLLYTLNQSALAEYLQTDGEQVWLDWSGEIDVQTFVQHVENGEWVAAVNLYNGHLLDGVVIGDSNPFEAWLTDQREQLRQKMLQALTALADGYEQTADWQSAESIVRRQLSLDSWNELFWRRLMTILAENGRRAQALSEFNNCRQVLKAELGVEPSAETEALHESIRDGHFQTTIQSSPAQHFAVPPPLPLPHPAAREALITKMQQQWVDDVLHSSLDGQPQIALKKADQPAALAYPWTTLINRPETKRKLRPPQQSITEIFEAEGRGLLILGEPGAGKTTSLLTLAADLLERAAADPAYPIPVLLPLASWCGQRLEDWVPAQINEQYRILPQFSADWVARNQLVLLLDGLDELPTEQQPDCVQAINRFREGHGLTPIAVCARQADYDALPAPLNLNGAVALQPLDQGQIRDFLADQFAELQAFLLGERKLLKMAQSPLFLSLITRLFGRIPAAELTQLAGNQTALFRVYVQQMLEDDQTSPDLVKPLRWLAQQLKQRNQPIFFLDRIQPDWLGSRFLIALYFVLSRFVGAFVLEVVWSYRDLGWGAIGAGIAFGILIALTELVLWWLSGRPFFRAFKSEQNYRLWRALYVGGWVSLVLIPYGWIALVNGLIFGLFFGWRAPTHRPDDDIRLVEKLAWSWRTFGIGIAVGLVLGSIVFFFNRADLYSAGTGLLSIVVLFGAFGGLQGSTISTKSRPNEGMWLSWRNAAVGGSVVGGAMLLAALGIELWREASLLTPFLVGLQYFVMAWLWYGGL
ncbi:MAG: BTAD domain-containing putative transcriptional regulator, partial [Chloroflexota bacterium]